MTELSSGKPSRWRVLVVDDEPIERAGVLSLISQYGLPFDPIEASSGETAMNYLLDQRVDVLLTDIRMPGISGLDLAREARRLYPDVKIVVLSAYGEFEYAREAIRLETVQYLLKPIVVEEFLEVMARLISLCERDASERQRANRDARERTLVGLLNGTGDPVDLGLGFDPSGALMLLIAHPSRLADAHRADLEAAILRTLTWPHMLLTVDQYQSLLLVERPNSAGEAEQRALGGQLLAELGAKFPDQRLALMMGAIGEGEAGIAETYQQLEDLGEYAFFSDRNLLLTMWEEEGAGAADSSFERAIDAVQHELDANRIPEAEALLRTMFDRLRNQLVSSPGFKYRCAALGTYILSRVDQDISQRHDSLVAEIYHAESMDRVADILRVLLEELSLVGMSAGSSQQRVVRAVENYVASHYEQDISLPDLARTLFLSPGHLSALFKKQTGQRVTTYITSYRIDRAKSLLLTSNRKVTDIAGQVGFADVSYFCAVFKSHTGTSPARFRERRSG